MTQHFSRLVRQVKNTRLPESALGVETTVRVVSPSSVLHAEQRWGGCSQVTGKGYYGTAQGAVAVKSLKVLSESVLCEECAYRFEYNFSRPLRAIREIVEAEGAVRRAKKTDFSSRKTGALEKTRRELVGQERNLAHILLEKVALPEDCVEALEEVRGEITRILESLARTAGGVAQQEKMKEFAREVLVSVAMRQRGMRLDESMVLVGVSPLVEGRLPKDMRELFDAFALRRGEVGVAWMPRYCFELFLRDMNRGQGASRSIVVGHACAEEAVAEVAAGLWDPSGKGELFDLLTAIEAAGVV